MGAPSTLAASCLAVLATLVASMAAGAGGDALADDGPAGAFTKRLYFYSGVDVARDNVYGWAGAAWSPRGLMDQEGLRVRLQGGGGQYKYRTDAVPGGWNTVSKTEGELLLGWQFLNGRQALAIYGGVNVTENLLDQPDPYNRDQGTAVGAKAVAEWYYRYDDDWTFTAALGGSTADETAFLRATAGRHVTSWFDLGAEAGASTDWLSQDARAGLFIATPLPGRQWRAAGGWRWSSDSDDGAYATLSLYSPF
ncbi:cellulose biosynthesis protein BcsS [Ancylobacter sp. MQZ15Z-1]|uniref:Cellulose biosynthesis protein BcsS n=1 Tax=Ancylobacter mangrovi TaxID=2972472 RepID=A0A9X2PH16_9HYPH|nr:cellulose biosynthesis protein BcsS [Ancylobacter mangrovi]MCS0496008.1 cellulose biosynthesis protein BcsS [Ancylobacter mangrovi]